MSEVLWPPDIIPSSQEWYIIPNVSSFQSPLSGAVRTVSRTGTKWGCRVTLPPIKGQDRARQIALRAALRDRSNTIWMPDFSQGLTIRGSFPYSQLLTNNDFSNGTTGWSGGAGTETLAVTDRIMRVTSGASGACSARQTSVACTQYAPYASRAFFGNSNTTGNLYSYIDGYGNAVTNGMSTASIVPVASSIAIIAAYCDGGQAGNFFSLPWISASRCALVDNGPNALLYSDQIDNAAWTKGGASVSANATTAPDGSSTADDIVEDSSTGQHYFSQTSVRASVAEDCVVYGRFKTRNSSRDIRLVLLAGGSDYATCIFNLTAGTAGTPSLTGSATNARPFIRGMGNGWYFCSLVARLPATTALNAEFDLVSSGSVSYAGNGTGAVAAWRCGAARSGVPTRGAQTTTTATTGSSQTSSTIYLKGLPVSTNGLLEIGDPVQIGTQRNVAISRLNSDAAGLGVLQVGLPQRVAPADSDPVFVHVPMAKMRVVSEIGWDTGPGLFSPFTIELEEDVT